MVENGLDYGVQLFSMGKVLFTPYSLLPFFPKSPLPRVEVWMNSSGNLPHSLLSCLMKTTIFCHAHDPASIWLPYVSTHGLQAPGGAALHCMRARLPFVLMVHNRICTQPDNQQEMLNLESQLYEWWTFSYTLSKGYEPKVHTTTLVLKKKRKIFRRGWILMFPLRSVQEYDPDPFHHKDWFLVAQEHTLFKGRACELLRLLCWLLKKQSGRNYYFASKLSWNCFCIELPCETHSLGECIFPTANQE